MRINFDFRDLEAFLAVAESGSFQRAAEQLNISQSAITRRIQKLESVLDLTLFERTTRSLKLTIEAKAFQPRAQGMVDDATESIQALRDDTAQFEHQRNAMINIAVIPTFTQNLLPAIIKEFQIAGYQVRINILDLLANEVVEAVAQGEADFGISFIGAQQPGLMFEHLIEDRFVLAMHRNHALFEQPDISWSELNNHAIVVPWKGTGNRLLIDNEMARNQHQLDWTYQVHHSSTALGLVEADLAAAILPQSTMSLKDNSDIVFRLLVEPEITRVIGSVRRTGFQLSSIAENFYKLVIKECSIRFNPPSNH